VAYGTGGGLLTALLTKGWNSGFMRLLAILAGAGSGAGLGLYHNKLNNRLDDL
jgi:ABC-type uncharacterized transport system permease subunit